jgi:hypothetical protein
MNIREHLIEDIVTVTMSITNTNGATAIKTRRDIRNIFSNIWGIKAKKRDNSIKEGEGKCE